MPADAAAQLVREVKRCAFHLTVEGIQSAGQVPVAPHRGKAQQKSQCRRPDRPRQPFRHSSHARGLLTAAPDERAGNTQYGADQSHPWGSNCNSSETA